MNRRISREVNIGSLTLGAQHPIAVQTMYGDPLKSVMDSPWYDSLLFTLRSWATMGASLVRFSYPSHDLKDTFTAICADSPVPVVADIHFDYRLAIEALQCGAAKIRINPGNIGALWKTREVVRAAQDHGAAIRIGLNGGSLPKGAPGEPVSSIMASAVRSYLDIFESTGFTNTVISVKHSDVDITYDAYKKVAALCDYPLHLGVTEAGSIVPSVTRSTWTLGRLLSEGIGDTIRISISDDNFYEISAAKELLRTVGIERGGVQLISCPRCGRATFDSQEFVKRIEKRLLSYETPLKVAIMGCQVNGPGEARHADLAITGIGRKVFLYLHGELVKEITAEEAEEELFRYLEELS
ncbi:MAG: (E)-4-hydroxy-3-methylbut-2-enyl-diphosphate synthase [Sphaerochaetaceae bacterium]|nr:(E)-4-hydroxy-3-methylbut-2-enyl-diphosphate synthase [Sphaerochaetaceae bacterium]